MTAQFPQPGAFLGVGYDSEPHSRMHGRVLEKEENVKAHGAVGDGVTNDAPAIQSAINAAYSGLRSATVFLPPGHYKITEGLTIYPGTHLRGAGPRATVILPFQGSDPAISLDETDFDFDQGYEGGSNAQLVIEAFTLGLDTPQTQTVPTATGHGISIAAPSAGSGILIRNIVFNVTCGTAGTNSWAVYNENHLETHIVDCYVTNCVGGGFYFKSNSNMSVVDRCVLNNGSGALGGILNEASRLTVTGTTIENWQGAYGLKTTGTNSSANIHNSWFEFNYGYGVIVDAGCAVSLVDCNISGSGGAPQILGSVNTLPGVGIERTWLTLLDCHATGEVNLANGATDVLRVMSKRNSYNTQPIEPGTFTTTDITNWANVFISREGDRRDALNATSNIGPLELVGEASHLRMEGGKIYFGTSADALSYGDTNLYRSAADTLKTDDNLVVTGDLTLSVSDIITDTATGTKIGTATNQKLGFFNKTPVVQPSAYTPTNVSADRAYDANATTTDELADVLGTLIADLKLLGLIG